jgi:hypothetical protein
VPCIVCNEGGSVIVPAKAWLQFQLKDGFIQDTLPMLSVEEREQLISGIHGPCFDSLFQSEEEENG